MDYDGLFFGSKWKILEIISKNPSSLQELAKELGTSLANISQQVRFLEFAGIVERTKISKNIAGKPESALSIKNDFSYVVLSTKTFCKKSLLHLDSFQELMFYSWIGLEGKERESFEEFLFSQKRELGVVERIYVEYVKVSNVEKDRLPKRYVVFMNGAPSVSKRTFGSLDFLFFDVSSKDSENYLKKLDGKNNIEGSTEIIFKR